MPSKTSKYLTEILANSYILMLKKQNYHWNVKGANFYSLHEMFGNQYEEQFEAIDEIAERIKTLGEHATGSLSEYLELSKIKDDRVAGVPAEKMLENLILDENTMIKLLGDAVKAAQSENDEASADLLVERTQAHQKNLWMLEASLN